jgi:long-chain fatty acid transport protein
MIRRLGICLRTLAALLLLSRLALADGIECDALEATSGGRGGTNIAHSDNGAVLLSNPLAF